jgi:phosphatidylglycerophosphate synthase
VTPNHVTTARLALGLAAGAAFAVGRGPWLAVGSVVFLASMLLDRADGELARLTGRMSRAGHRYDLVADATSNAWAFVGLGIGQRDGPLGAWAVPAGLAAGVGVAAALGLVLRREAVAGPRAAELAPAWGFDADDAMLVVPVAVLLGGALPLLVGAAIGAPVFAGWLAWRLRARPAGRPGARAR